MTRRQTVVFALGLAVAALSPSSLGQAEGRAASFEGIVRPSTDLMLGFTVTGVVEGVNVEAGDTVEAGQVLASLDGSVSLARIELLTVRAESDLAVAAAEAELDLARNEEARVREAYEQDAASIFEVERASLQTVRADVRLRLAQQARREAELERAQALAAHERMTLRAPGSGIVEAIEIDPGEFAESARPIVRIVAVDPVVVEAALPISATAGVRTGDDAEVLIPGIESPQRAGVVSFVSSLGDAASGTRMVRIEVANPDGAIVVGSEASVRILD